MAAQERAESSLYIRDWCIQSPKDMYSLGCPLRTCTTPVVWRRRLLWKGSWLCAQQDTANKGFRGIFSRQCLRTCSGFLGVLSHHHECEMVIFHLGNSYIREIRSILCGFQLSFCRYLVDFRWCLVDFSRELVDLDGGQNPRNSFFV